MTVEHQFFIQILEDHVHDRVFAPETDKIDWENIL